MTLDRMVQIVVRICHVRPFRSRLFPLACMRQALTLYSILTDLGYPVNIYFGITKNGEQLRGHSWITLEGKPIAEIGDPTSSYHIVYSHPASQPGAIQDVTEMFGANEKLF